jgi:hypothetical protein
MVTQVKNLGCPYFLAEGLRRDELDVSVEVTMVRMRLATREGVRPYLCHLYRPFLYCLQLLD